MPRADLPIEGRELGDDPYGALATRRPKQRRILPADDGMSERNFQSAVIAMAQAEGYLVFHAYDSRRSEAGFPDLVMAHPVRGTIFAELKTASGKTTGAQDLWYNTLDSGGAEVYLWRPADLASGYIREILTSPRPT